MKNLLSIAYLSIFFSLISCQKDIPILEQQEAVFQSELPTYPMVYLMIIEREYELLTFEENIPYSRLQYFEKRLTEWFPKVNIKGKLLVSAEEVKTYENNFIDWSKLSGDTDIFEEDVLPYKNFEDDTNFIKLSEKELVQFNYLEAIAKKNYNKVKLDSVLSLPSRYFLYGIPFLHIPLHISIVSKYSVFRIYLSHHRAIEKTKYYYPETKSSGSKGDAFRHIFVSMHLRRYLGRPASALIMSSYEKIYQNPNLRDTYMDLHNNKLGRHKCYWKFRGHIFNDKYKWHKWARNIKSFVDDQSNGVDMDWENNHSTNYLKEAQEVHPKRYIYYK